MEPGFPRDDGADGAWEGDLEARSATHALERVRAPLSGGDDRLLFREPLPPVVAAAQRGHWVVISSLVILRVEILRVVISRFVNLHERKMLRLLAPE